VNFVTPLAPNTSTYFSLENALSSATACPDILNGAVRSPSLGGRSFSNGLFLNPTTISTSFTPNFGFTISQAASACGFQNFDWIQTITNLPGVSPVFQNPPGGLLSAPPAFNDPAPGGYTYCSTPPPLGLGVTCDNAPFYYGVNAPASNPLSLAANETTPTMLSYYDAPGDWCLLGSSGSPSAAWNANDPVPGLNGVSTPIQSICSRTQLSSGALAFTTHLAGVLPNGSPQDLGIGFSWTDNFNGSSGGIATLLNFLPTDDGSGDGGIVLTSFTNTTNYQFGPPALSVTFVALAAAVPEPPTMAMFAFGAIILLAVRRNRWGLHRLPKLAKNWENFNRKGGRFLAPRIPLLDVSGQTLGQES
jgi:hypothetical protein